MANTKNETIIAGAGITGLSAGYASGIPIYEAETVPGGICTSYYMEPGTHGRRFTPPQNDNAYHFELGGGHWIFGGDPIVKAFINRLAPYQTYERKSSVFLPDQKNFVPYPIQNYLSFLEKATAKKALTEMLAPSNKKIITFKDWLEVSFGKTLGKLFFNPFNDLYTAGLYSKIAPQDSYKSPINKDEVKKGYHGKSHGTGYNTTFIYPKQGLDTLTRNLAEKCTIHYGKRITKINLKKKSVLFSDNTSTEFKTLISTLPLNEAARIANIDVGEKPFPSPSVLVINIGAKKGRLCPQDHWVYISKSKSGFHRVGFYSNVDPMFLPKQSRKKQETVSIYVEKAYPENTILSSKALSEISQQIIKELQDWQWIGEVEVFDPTWIKTAYTWSWPNSSWKEKVLKELQAAGVYQVGRYGRWMFQGIADSVKDGLVIGGTFAK